MSGNEEHDRRIERELVARIAAGETELFRSVIDRYGSMVYAMIRRQVADDETARDLSQETFLRVYRGLNSFRGDAALGSWIVRIALNTTAGYFQSRAYKERNRTTSFDEPPPESPVSEESSEPYSQRDRDDVRTAVAELKPIFRDVVVLCCLEGRTYQEAAQALGIPLGTVCSRLNSGLHQLRTKLRRSGS